MKLSDSRHVQRNGEGGAKPTVKGGGGKETPVDDIEIGRGFTRR
jgi:hypothetical protein